MMVLDPLSTCQVPHTKTKLPICPPGPIDPPKPFQSEITVTWMTLEAMNVPLDPPPKWGFQAIKDTVKRWFWTH